MSSLSKRVWVRALIVVALSLFMAGGPFYRQVLGGKNKLFRPWVMFTGFGRDICDVEYIRMTPEGPEPLDRFALLGKDRWSMDARSTRRIGSPRAVRAMGKRLCRAIDIENPDIRVFSRCGSYRGWRPDAAGEENLCVRQASSP